MSGLRVSWVLCVVAVVVPWVIAGCATGPGTDVTTAQAAVERWSRSLESGSVDDYSSVLDPAYSYDGAEGGALGVPRPGFFGASGSVVVEVLEVVESGDAATARVRVQYTGFLSDVLGGGSDEGQGDATGSWRGPGFAPPNAPDAPDDEDDSEDVSRPLLREVQGEQATATPVSFTATVVLGLRRVTGSWMVVSQRQEYSVFLVGNGAEAPVITSLTGNGSDRPEVEPRAAVALAGVVEGASEGAVFTRLGYIQRSLTLEGEILSGEIRAPRIPGEYVLEVYAERVTPMGAYGIASRGIEVEVLDVPAVGFSFSVAEGINPDAAATDTVRGLLEALQGGADPAPYFSSDYDYDGQTAETAAWSIDSPFTNYYGDGDIAAMVTGVEPIPGGQALTVELVMEIDDFGYGGVEPVYGGPRASTATEPSRGPGLMPEPYGPVHSEATYRFEVSSADGLITAARALTISETRGDVSPPSLEDLRVNGSDSPSVVGAEPLLVTGTATGSMVSVHVSPDQMWEYAEGGGAFSVTVRAPFVRGRWVLRAETWMWGDNGAARALRTVEVTVTEDAPTPEVTEGAGVDLSPGAKATLAAWLSWLYLGQDEHRDRAYSPNYAFNGLGKAEMLLPRIQAYHAEITRAEVTLATRVGDVTRLLVGLEFIGPMQYFGTPYGRIDGGNAATGDGGVSYAPGYQALNAFDVLLELGADERIVAEWIRYGVSREVEAPALALGPVTVAGGTGPIPVGKAVEVQAEVTEGTADGTVVRLGALESWQQAPSAVLTAPELPGRYVAEVVAQSGEVSYGDGEGDEASEPGAPYSPRTRVQVISAAEVRVD